MATRPQEQRFCWEEIAALGDLALIVMTEKTYSANNPNSCPV